MIRGGGAATPAGDALSRVASVLCPRSRAPALLTHPHPRPGHARRPRASPPPRARATPARRSEPQGRFGRPPLSAPSPGRALARRLARGLGRGGAGRATARGGLARPRAGAGFARSPASPPDGRAVICRLEGSTFRVWARSHPPPASVSASREAARIAAAGAVGGR